jgi:hypothetical protein
VAGLSVKLCRWLYVYLGAQSLVDLMAGWLKSEEQVARELVSDGVREDCTKHKQAKATGWTAALTVD